MRAAPDYLKLWLWPAASTYLFMFSVIDSNAVSLCSCLCGKYRSACYYWDQTKNYFLKRNEVTVNKYPFLRFSEHFVSFNSCTVVTVWTVLLLKDNKISCDFEIQYFWVFLLVFPHVVHEECMKSGWRVHEECMKSAWRVAPLAFLCVNVESNTLMWEFHASKTQTLTLFIISFVLWVWLEGALPHQTCAMIYLEDSDLIKEQQL